MYYYGNRYLSLAEQKINAQYIANYFIAKGWSRNAIAGMLGNMQTESTCNPAIWQSLKSGNLEGGYGLVQWTKAPKILNWLDSMGYSHTSLNAQCERIIWELDNGEQYYETSAYPLTFREFSQSGLEPEYLAYVFINNYERPEERNQPQRKTQARYWYNEIDYTGSYIPPIDEENPPPDEENPPPETTLGEIYNLIISTSYNTNQLTQSQIIILDSLKIGDLVKFVFTFNRSKKDIGINYTGKRLTIDSESYTIESVRSNGFLVLKNGIDGCIKIVNPKLIEKGETI